MILLQGAVAAVNGWGRELPQSLGPEYHGDFDRYCTHSSVLLLHWQAEMLTSGTTTWVEPVVQLLEAPAPYLGSYFWFTPEVLESLENPIAPAIRAFRQTRLFKTFDPSPEHPHLGTLTRLLQLDECCNLALSYLAVIGRTNADFTAQIDVEFQPGLFDKSLVRCFDREELRLRSSETMRFRGSVLEFCAHLPPNTWKKPRKGLYKILELSGWKLDPSTVMLLSVRNHQHWTSGVPALNCSGCLVFTHLLQLGAQSTVPGFSVGSLQIAVALQDEALVQLLLEAGIDPNDIGDLGGDIGTPETGPMLKWFRCIRGRSPLNIARGRLYAYSTVADFACVKKWTPSVNAPSLHDRVEQILVQYGGRDFTTFLDDDLSLATKLEKVGMFEDTRADEKQMALAEQ